MGVKNKSRNSEGAVWKELDSSTEIPGNDSYNTIFCRITRSCDMVVKLKGAGTMYLLLENEQTCRKLFDLKFNCRLQVEMHFYLDNHKLQVKASSSWCQDIVIDPEKVVRLKIQVTKGIWSTLITENGHTVLKQPTEIAESYVATEIAGARDETITDEDGDVDDRDLVFVEVSPADEEEEDALATGNATGPSVATAKRSLETAAMKKDDDADDFDDYADDENFLEISTLITENGHTVLKQHTEKAESYVATEIAGARDETIKDEDGEVDDRDLVFVEVSPADEEEEGALVTGNATGPSVATAKRSLETAAMKKDDDADDFDDDADDEDFLEISNPE
ncbi:uncharacterized protein LOC123536207 [Mercenaria mercenaria]|uniref:uncharacterized protein LOC123536207 n=1 Tax=Mercenaria mercenaria TaxID=6596 RepID=UPI00234F759E|nr:uncharacterized protein LOC123536207 [Mercenaria mercenaria]